MSNTESNADAFPGWGANAPRGGKAVFNRILKEGTKVPLFLGQTFIASLRDVGYNDSTAAICEHVDNAIQAKATEIRVYFNQTGRQGEHEVDVAILDNGVGMAPHVLQAAMSFGGSMHYQNRQGIGRFGVGMKTAAISMGPVLDVYSWQEPGSIYSMTLDVEEIGESRANMIELPEPTLHTSLPAQVTALLAKPMGYPKDANAQELFAYGDADIAERLGQSGTLIFIPSCDRLSSKLARTLVDHATRDMSRIYRHQLGQGLKLYVNNRRIEAFDPTYWMQGARHTKIADLSETQSRLIQTWRIEIPVEEGSAVEGLATVKLYMLPIESWYGLPRKTLKDLQVFDDNLVSFMRNDREVHLGTIPELSGKRHGDSAWLRIQIEFDGNLDEAFGVAMNKQGVRPKKYALELIRENIREDVRRVRERTAEFRAQHAREGAKARISEAERIAQEADALQGKPLKPFAVNTPEEQEALDQNLRGLALSLKRHDETDDEAFQRVKESRYITAFKHDPYWPFYHVDYQLGKVILTVNTAHPFFAQLYEPLSRLAAGAEGDEGDGSGSTPQGASTQAADLLVRLQMLLFSLARTQSQMLGDEGSSNERRILFENLRRDWSDALRTQLQSTAR